MYFRRVGLFKFCFVFVFMQKSVAALDGVVAVPCNLQAAKQGRRPL